MAIDTKKVEEFEKEYKDSIFRKILYDSSKQFEIINYLTTNATYLGKSHRDIPNACTTINNKLVELSHQFNRAGISMFAKKNENYDLVSSSFVGDSIIRDLNERLVKSKNKLREHCKTIDDVFKKRDERLLALQNVGPIRKLFSIIKSLFVPVKPVDFSLTEEEQGILDSSLKEYTDIESEIWNYSLEKNLIPALVKEIAGPKELGRFNNPYRHRAATVPGLLEQHVIPDLKKLGLEHLIPQLQEALIEEYKRDLSDSKIYQIKDEDMHLYVPDFSQKPPDKREVTEESQGISQPAQGVIQSIKKDEVIAEKDDEIMID